LAGCPSFGASVEGREDKISFLYEKFIGVTSKVSIYNPSNRMCFRNVFWCQENFSGYCLSWHKNIFSYSKKKFVVARIKVLAATFLLFIFLVTISRKIFLH